MFVQGRRRQPFDVLRRQGLLLYIYANRIKFCRGSAMWSHDERDHLQARQGWQCDHSSEYSGSLPRTASRLVCRPNHTSRGLASMTEEMPLHPLPARPPTSLAAAQSSCSLSTRRRTAAAAAATSPARGSPPACMPIVAAWVCSACSEGCRSCSCDMTPS